MSTSRYFNRICAVVMVLCLVLTVMLCIPDKIGIQAASRTLGYESKLFDTSYVHSVDIVMNNWDSFIESCENEEYASCSVVIDGEAFKNTAIRAKGNTSLSSVSAYGNDRYSFKLEFDHYNDGASYYGLDKLCLNNIIQDNTYIKDYLCYTMMNFSGANAPLCSFAFITVNGEDWGLYLAVESVEDSFLERNYSGTGNLYKPDSLSMGGGRGNGKNFDQENFDFDNTEKFTPPSNTGKGTSNSENSDRQPPQRGNFNGFGENGGRGGFGGMGMGSDDVKLVYTDDDFDSYENIFDNAKTDITNADKTRLINSLKVLSSDEAASTVDVDAVIKYFAVHNSVCSFDSYTGSMIHNYYLYENDGILSMIPWDYNLAFGSFMGGGDGTSMINFPIDSPVSGGDTDSRPMIAWIFADEEYTELYHEALSEFIADYFESGYFETEIERVKALISPYVEKDPTKFCTYDEFTAGISALKEFCVLRAKSVRGQLDGTVPSTSEAQSADSSALIDGSSVNISATGSMSMGGGKDNMQGGMNGNMPGFNFGTPPDQNGFGGDMPEFPNFGENSPEQPNGNAPPGEQAASSDERSTGGEDAPTSQSGDEVSPERPVNGSFNKNSMSEAPRSENNSDESMQQTTADGSSDAEKVILLCISAGALLAALLLSRAFKDRI
ncbi:MAG: CotH kinase family protein [Oscillospiraceae bacterium]